jgi:hypothetical protein
MPSSDPRSLSSSSPTPEPRSPSPASALRASRSACAMHRRRSAHARSAFAAAATASSIAASSTRQRLALDEMEPLPEIRLRCSRSHEPEGSCLDPRAPCSAAAPHLALSSAPIERAAPLHSLRELLCCRASRCSKHSSHVPCCTAALLLSHARSPAAPLVLAGPRRRVPGCQSSAPRACHSSAQAEPLPHSSASSSAPLPAPCAAPPLQAVLLRLRTAVSYSARTCACPSSSSALLRAPRAAAARPVRATGCRGRRCREGEEGASGEGRRRELGEERAQGSVGKQGALSGEVEREREVAG